MLPPLFNARLLLLPRSIRVPAAVLHRSGTSATLCAGHCASTGSRASTGQPGTGSLGRAAAGAAAKRAGWAAPERHCGSTGAPGPAGECRADFGWGWVCGTRAAMNAVQHANSLISASALPCLPCCSRERAPRKPRRALHSLLGQVAAQQALPLRRVKHLPSSNRLRWHSLQAVPLQRQQQGQQEQPPRVSLTSAPWDPCS